MTVERGWRLLLYSQSDPFLGETGDWKRQESEQLSTQKNDYQVLAINRAQEKWRKMYWRKFQDTG